DALRPRLRPRLPPRRRHDLGARHERPLAAPHHRARRAAALRRDRPPAPAPARTHMNLWIDTSTLARAQALFGLPPLERLRRSAAKASEGATVVLSGPAASPAAWPGAKVDADTAPL